MTRIAVRVTARTITPGQSSLIAEFAVIYLTRSVPIRSNGVVFALRFRFSRFQFENTFSGPNVLVLFDLTQSGASGRLNDCY